MTIVIKLQSHSTLEKEASILYTAHSVVLVSIVRAEIFVLVTAKSATVLTERRI